VKDLRPLDKQKETKPKNIVWKEIVTIRAEINGMDTNVAIQKNQ
jgi:hypothetical protein